MNVTEQSRRLAILVSLSLATRYRLILSDLRAVVDGAGYPASLDRLRADVAWLEETGLVGFERPAEIVEITARGLDVAGGYAEVPGVGRPGPGA
jgi:hypothetical protein